MASHARCIETSGRSSPTKGDCRASARLTAESPRSLVVTICRNINVPARMGLARRVQAALCRRRLRLRRGSGITGRPGQQESSRSASVTSTKRDSRHVEVGYLVLKCVLECNLACACMDPDSSGKSTSHCVPCRAIGNQPLSLPFPYPVMLRTGKLLHDPTHPTGNVHACTKYFTRTRAPRRANNLPEGACPPVY